jgi:dipeptidase E
VAASACPHYDNEAHRRPLYHRLVVDGFPAGYAADEGAALHFDSAGALVEAAPSRQGARPYRVERRPDGAAGEQPLPTRYLG